MSDNTGTTQELLDGRAATYGDRVKNMTSLSDMINGYMDGVEQRSGTRDFGPQDVAMMMVLTKAYRFAVAPDYKDNIADIFGYAQIAEECVGDKMIVASSAQEYQAIKESRKRAPMEASEARIKAYESGIIPGYEGLAPGQFVVATPSNAADRKIREVTQSEGPLPARTMKIKMIDEPTVPAIDLSEQVSDRYADTVISEVENAKPAKIVTPLGHVLEIPPDNPLFATLRDMFRAEAEAKHFNESELPIERLAPGTPEYDAAYKAFQQFERDRQSEDRS